jgi:Domain of unknown function DUF11
MLIRLAGVLLFIAVGIMATIGTATAVPGEAPLIQTTAELTSTAAALQAALTQTAGALLTPSATPTRTNTPTNTPVPSITPFPPGLVDLQILKSASRDPIATNDTFSYTITVTSFSTVGASSPPTTMVDTLPTGVVLLSATGGNGCTSSSTTTFGTSTVTCNVPSLAPNQSSVFTLTVQVSATTGTILTNTAQVDPGNVVIETNESNNFATTTTTVGATAVVATSTTGPAAPTSTPVTTSITVVETPVPPTAVPTSGGTTWVRIVSPQQVYSVDDDPLWIAQNDELYWVAREEAGWLLVVWEGDSKAWSVWIRDQGVVRLTLDRPAPPDAGDVWLVAFGRVQTYFEDMSPAWITSAGEWYFVILREGGWALVRYETDPPNIVVWIQEGPGVEYTTFDAPHQIG